MRGRTGYPQRCRRAAEPPVRPLIRPFGPPSPAREKASLVCTAGALIIDRLAFRDAADDVAASHLGAPRSPAAGGGDRPPRGDRLAALAERVAGHGDVTATLAGAKVIADASQVLIARNPGEAARGGLAPITLSAAKPPSGTAGSRSPPADARSPSEPSPATPGPWTPRPARPCAHCRRRPGACHVGWPRTRRPADLPDPCTGRIAAGPIARGGTVRRAVGMIRKNLRLKIAFADRALAKRRSPSYVGRWALTKGEGMNLRICRCWASSSVVLVGIYM